jgi:nucleoid-associated protein YgaU
MSIISRYTNRRIFKNKREEYQSYFDDRNRKSIRQYNSPSLPYPTKEDIADLNLVTHIYKSTDKLANLAAYYYSDPTLWWVIAWFNKKPGEFAIKPGEALYIPFPLEYILASYGY